MAKVTTKMTARVKAPAKSSKIRAASLSFNEEIALLLQLASDAPVLTFPKRKSAAKLFELAILAELFFEFRASTGGTVNLIQPTKKGRANTFAGAPASADKADFAWFELRDLHGTPIAEAWVSVQFVGLSATLAARHLAPGIFVNVKASSHELDISLLKPEDPKASPRLYPKHTEVLAGISAKHVSILEKDSVREALGFRREMGLFAIKPRITKTDWLRQHVPCDPSSPLFLVSSAKDFHLYDGHIDELGIYPVFMKFPY